MAQKKFTYLGWKRFTDTGHLYREWRLDEVVPELKAAENDTLCDHGAGDHWPTQERFDVRTEHKKHGRCFSLETVENALGLGLPPWKPPREEDLAMTRAIKSVASALAEVTKAIDRANTDRTALQAIKNVVDTTRAASTPTADPRPTEKQNKYLRLKGEYEYDNGDEYTDFELLVDVPEIPVTRVEALSPMHAAKGDVLRERYDDELTPFELRRNGKRIGDPEWWQVRHLFHGIKEGAPEKPEPEPTRLDPLQWERARALRAVEPGRLRCSVYRVERDVEAVNLRVGDVVVYTRRPPNFPTMHGRVRYPTVEDYQALSDAIGSLKAYRQTFAPLREDEYTRLLKLINDRKRWGLRAKVWRPRLAFLRVPWETLTEPIHAASDDAALFELLAQVGGQMPKEGDHV